MRSIFVALGAVLIVTSSAQAQEAQPGEASLLSSQQARDPWGVDWLASADAASPPLQGAALSLQTVALQDDPQPLHAAAIEHSEAYQRRAKIHKYASFATLPLFAAEVALGQSLYNTPANTGGKRAAHAAVGAGIVGLFGVNTVTGAWNLFGEGRQDKSGRTLRLLHGLLMMAADVGFLATVASGPNSENEHQALGFEGNKVRHRNIAIASIGVGTAGYLMMLFGNR